MNKILLAGLAGVVAATAATAEVSQCGNGGFYIGGGVGAVFGKLTVKKDSSTAAKAANEQAAKAIDALTALNKTSADAQAAVTAAQTVVTTDVTNTAAAIIKVLDKAGTDMAAVNGVGIAGIIQQTNAAGNVPAYAAGTLGALANSANGVIAASPIAVMAKKLISLNADLATVVLTANNKANLNDGLVKALSTAYNTTDATKATTLKTSDLGIDTAAKLTNFYPVAAAPGNAGDLADATAAANSLIAYGADGKATTNLLAKTTTDFGTFTTATTTYTTAAKAYTDAFAKVQTAMLAAEKTATAPTTAVNVALFGTDGKTTPTFADFSAKLKAAANANAALEATELGLSDKGRAHKKATGFMGEIFVGYDHRIGDMMVGAEVSGFFVGGGKAKIKDKKAAKGSDALTGRMKYGFQIMGRGGYLISPNFEVYGTVGMMGASLEGNTTNLKTILDQTQPYYSAAAAAKAISGDTTAATANAEWNAKNKKYKKFKMIPVIGAGVRYEISPEMFTKLEYNYAFKKQIVSQEKANAALSYQAHILKVGFGVRFGS